MDQEYKDCGKHIGQYTLIKLPRGTTDSHKDFKAAGTKYKQARKKDISGEEASRMLMAKEEKIASGIDEILSRGNDTSIAMAVRRITNRS